MGSQHMYSLSWGEFGTSLSSTVQVLRGQNEMVDVTLAAGGKIFPAHKLVLSAASPLLMELLKSTQCAHPVVMLAGITAPDLEALLQFVYQGEVSVDPGQLPSLLQAAHCLDIQALTPQPASASEKTSVHITVPIVTDEDQQIETLPLTNNDHAHMVISPLQPVQDTNAQVETPVRKRKRKRVDKHKCPSAEGLLSSKQVNLIPATHLEIDHGIDHLLATELSDSLNTQSEDQHSEAETTASAKKLISELPVQCTVCGVTIRQSRNLKRHMELIHLKFDSAKRKSLLMEETKKKKENVQCNSPMQTIEENSERGRLVEKEGVEILAVPQHMMLPPPLYHIPDNVVPSQPQAAQFSRHENLFSQQSTALLHSPGLYSDASKQCITE